MTWETEDMNAEFGATANDRREARSADAHDRTEYRRINGQWMDADRVPDESDVQDC